MTKKIKAAKWPFTELMPRVTSSIRYPRPEKNGSNCLLFKVNWYCCFSLGGGARSHGVAKLNVKLKSYTLRCWSSRNLLGGSRNILLIILFLTFISMSDLFNARCSRRREQQALRGKMNLLGVRCARGWSERLWQWPFHRWSRQSFSICFIIWSNHWYWKRNVCSNINICSQIK